MKKLLSLVFILALASCGKDKTLDQQTREKLAGTWASECQETKGGHSSSCIAEDVYGDEYNSTTITIKKYQDTECTTSQNDYNIVYTGRTTTGFVEGETNKTDKVLTYLGADGVKYNVEILTADFIVRDNTSPTVAGFFFGTPPVCDTFVGTPVNNKAYSMLNCEAMDNIEIGDMWYITGIIVNNNNLFLSTPPKTKNNPNERTLLDSEDDLWSSFSKE